MPKDPEARKAASIAKLQAENIPAIDWLPVIESVDKARIRSAEEIARRAIACLITIQAACEQNDGNYNDESAAWCHGLLEQYNVADEITANERAILAKQGSEQGIINMVWKYEAYWTLLWALGIVEKLDYPDHIVDCQFAIDAVASCDDFADFMAKTRLRDIEEILDETDLIYRYHWACVDARINGREMPGGLLESVVMERHAGLNWLIGAYDCDDWDDVPVHT
jgi:hypothetical protein